MNDFYIFYRNKQEGIEKIIIEQIEAETKEKAKFNFIKKISYDNNEWFDTNNIIFIEIKDAYEYNLYLKSEYTKESEKKNAKKWINNLNQLLNNEIESFKIKIEDYTAFYHIVEQNNFIGKVTKRKEKKYFIILDEKREMEKLM